MAQAARLNLRMQKELKLLLSDPPPGASFPLLSGEFSSSSSLSTIHAQIEGPVGTVYERGVFSVTIQIPERYPFQPPCVTFATPIYHPNIDTGGRICLDILNLPPKGAWRPSLNISIVLTSIGLLLSEPNPDDGLMCEASKEYKYNRQAFDQKARSMTEKYAKAGLHGNGSETILIFQNSSKMEAEGSNLNSKHEVTEHIASHSKASRISPKLSLAPLGSTQKRSCIVRTNEMPNKLQKSMDTEGPEEGLTSTDMQNLNHDELPGAKQKLPLSSLCYSKTRDSDIQNNAVENLSRANPQSVPIASSEFSVNLSNGCSENNGLQSSKDASATTNDFNKSNCKKLFSVGKKLSLGLSGSSNVLEYDKKENIRLLKLLQDNDDKHQLVEQSQNQSKLQCKTLLPLSPDHKCNKQLSNVGPDDKIGRQNNKQGAELTDELPVLDAIIVLDSEDSEEDSAPSISKPLVARKRLLGKRKPTSKIEQLHNMKA